MYSHQVDSIRAIRIGQSPMLLQLIQGAGKTAIALCSMPPPILFLCPPHVVSAIQAETVRLRMASSVTVVSYAVASRWATLPPHTSLILDEFHLISAKVQAMVTNFDHVLALSATPRVTPPKGWPTVSIITAPLDPRFQQVVSRVRYETQPWSMPDVTRSAYDSTMTSIRSSQPRDRFHGIMRARAFLSLSKAHKVAAQLISGSAPSHKILIVSEFAPTLVAIAALLPPSSYVLAMNSASVERFQSSSRQFLLSPLRYTSHGINLGYLDGIILIESTYRQHAIKHLIGRLHRLGSSPSSGAMRQLVVAIYYADSIECALKYTGDELNFTFS